MGYAIKVNNSRQMMSHCRSCCGNTGYGVSSPGIQNNSNYSQVSIKQIGPNKRVGWIFYVNFIKIGPNKEVGLKSKMSRPK